MELSPFDPADYLDSEEGVEAYLSDARTDGPGAYSRALEVVDRARARMRRKRPIDMPHLRTRAE